MGNRHTESRYPHNGPQLRVPATREQLEDLDIRAEAADMSRAEYARSVLWPVDEIEDLGPVWECEAKEAVIEAMSQAEWHERGVSVPGEPMLAEPTDGAKIYCESLADLMRVLTETYEAAWHGSVPYEDGTAVFTPHAVDAISALLELNYPDELRKLGWYE